MVAMTPFLEPETGCHNARLGDMRTAGKLNVLATDVEIIKRKTCALIVGEVALAMIDLGS